jgi:hypothetical protein
MQIYFDMQIVNEYTIEQEGIEYIVSILEDNSEIITEK